MTNVLQTHLNQLAHVRKGCLVQPREDITSDRSWIEGSYKGWNALQRSFLSGVELITVQSHDFVHRQNCQVTSNAKKPEAFNSSTHSSHHVRLVNVITIT